MPHNALHDDAGITLSGARGRMAQAFISRMQNQWYPFITDITDTTREQEKYRMFGTVPLPQKGNRPKFGTLNEFGVDIYSYIFMNAAQLPRKLLDFDQTGQSRTVFSSMGARLANFPQSLVGKIIKNGESTTLTWEDKETTNIACYDTKALFSATHNIGGEDQSNISESALTPTVYEDTTTTWVSKVYTFLEDFDKASDLFDRMHDGRNEPWHDELLPQNLAFLGNRRMANYARFLMNAAQLPGGGSNTWANSVGRIISTPRDLDNRDFTAGTGNYVNWYLCEVSGSMQPVIFQRFRPKTAAEFEDPIEGVDDNIIRGLQAIEMIAINRTGTEMDSYTFFNDAVLFGSRAIYGVGPGHWQGIVKSRPTQ